MRLNLLKWRPVAVAARHHESTLALPGAAESGPSRARSLPSRAGLHRSSTLLRVWREAVRGPASGMLAEKQQHWRASYCEQQENQAGANLPIEHHDGRRTSVIEATSTNILGFSNSSAVMPVLPATAGGDARDQSRHANCQGNRSSSSASSPRPPGLTSMPSLLE